MKFPPSFGRAVAPLVTFALIASVLVAQQPRVPATAETTTTAQETAAASNVTLDTLFGADSYAVYGEVRSVGQYVSSEDFKQMLEPLRLPGMMPPELSDLFDFINAHAEALATSRLAFGAMPVADGLPDAIAAVELSSAEDAQKLEPQLRQFLATYYAAHADALRATPDTEQTDATRTTTSAAGTTTTTGATLDASAPPARVAANSASVGRAAARRREQSQQSQQSQTVRASEKVETVAPAPYFIKRAGSVVVMANKQFTFRRLRGASGAQLLMNEPGFQAARSRLASDTLFLYFNTKRMSRYTKRQMEEYERQRKLAEAEAAKSRAGSGNNSNNTALLAPDDRPIPYGAGANMNANVAVVTNANVTVANSNVAIAVSGSNSNSNSASPSEEVVDMREPIRPGFSRAEDQSDDEPTPVKEDEATRRERERQREFSNQLERTIFSGDMAEGTWAESIGVGASLENDQVVARALFYADSDARPLRPIPFIPILLSGPQVAPEASAVVPADADIFVSASLDLPQMYDYVASVFKIFDMAASAAGETDKQGLFESQISTFEKESKFRIKEDLFNSLGNEIAVVLPSDILGFRRARQMPKASGDAQQASGAAPEGVAPDAKFNLESPVVIISLNDKKAVEELLPRALEAVGIKGVTEQQLIQKRGDVETLNFGNGSVAFIDHFLVLAFSRETLDWIVDAYNKRETLANSEEFRRTTGWQERQLLGQVYVSNALLKEMFTDVRKGAEDIEEPALRNYLMRLDPNPGAITHALTKDGSSLFHELHVPKNLLALLSASSIVAQKTAALRHNESMAMFAVQVLSQKESEFKESNGRYASLEELKATPTATVSQQGFYPYKVEGYEIKLNVSGDKFELTATPTAYPKQGRRSFYINQTGVLHGGDLGGKSATAESEPIGS